MFINIQVDESAAGNPDIVKKLIEVCPVAIFTHDDAGKLAIQENNLDECVLCDLCLEVAPEGSVRVIKLYEAS